MLARIPNPITQSCFAMEIRVLAKLTLGNMDRPPGGRKMVTADKLRC